MTSSTANRRQRTTGIVGFSCAASAFLSHGTAPGCKKSFVPSTCLSENGFIASRDFFLGNAIDPPRRSDANLLLLMVAAPPPKVDSSRLTPRFSQPVPPAKPHEILHPRRGRNSRRRSREAEHFRKYIHLRRQLKPWSDDFRAKNGRTPSLIDVHASDIPGLLDRFVEYLEALEGLRFDV